MPAIITPLRRKTIIGWMLVCLAVTGLLAYEWIPEHLRGGWIIYLLLLASGAVLRVGQAVILGLMAFVFTALYMFYKASMGLPIEQQTLMLVLNPAAPLWLSAIYHNLQLRRVASSALLELNQRTDVLTLNMAASAHFMLHLDILCRRSGTKGYRVIDVVVTNHLLILDMLGDQVWQSARLRMLEVLEQHADDAVFVFAENGLTHLRCLQVTQFPEDETEPLFVQRLRGIKELILQVRMSAHICNPTVEASS
ncbi:hypothetical protein SAMN02745117_00231 [Lampropedia hyalina DSM 16112]|jgi:hypothetical protein|uniref:Uncharacterized protein n=1 Tax=Lampropedia hyalina DSM 16112 TaxID=1122156 RepID=A0A1M4T573_9BURK|nr:hypothetical protein [Lampropedia hyalina]SHE39619.1 hypothetical protein SAMN02745117_00231 [Lampropedia hyalina DSM 16112]